MVTLEQMWEDFKPRVEDRIAEGGDGMDAVKDIFCALFGNSSVTPDGDDEYYDWQSEDDWAGV